MHWGCAGNRIPTADLTGTFVLPTANVLKFNRIPTTQIPLLRRYGSDCK